MTRVEMADRINRLRQAVTAALEALAKNDPDAALAILVAAKGAPDGEDRGQ